MLDEQSQEPGPNVHQQCIFEAAARELRPKCQIIITPMQAESMEAPCPMLEGQNAGLAHPLASPFSAVTVQEVKPPGEPWPAGSPMCAREGGRNSGSSPLAANAEQSASEHDESAIVRRRELALGSPALLYTEVARQQHDPGSPESGQPQEVNLCPASQ